MRARLLTADELHSRSWQHVRYDVYGDARLERDHALACRAAITGLPPRATIAGPSAAFLWGVEHAAGADDDVHLIAPPEARISPRRGVRVHAVHLGGTERVDGAPPRTTPLRTAWDVAGWLTPLAAVPIIDSLLAAQLVGTVELADMVAARAGKRGSRRAATAFGLADARAQSVPESRLRVRFVLAGHLSGPTRPMFRTFAGGRTPEAGDGHRRRSACSGGGVMRRRRAAGAGRSSPSASSTASTVDTSRSSGTPSRGPRELGLSVGGGDLRPAPVRGGPTRLAPGHADRAGPQGRADRGARRRRALRDPVHAGRSPSCRAETFVHDVLVEHLHAAPSWSGRTSGSATRPPATWRC